MPLLALNGKMLGCGITHCDLSTTIVLCAHMQRILAFFEACPEKIERWFGAMRTCLDTRFWVFFAGIALVAFAVRYWYTDFYNYVGFNGDGYIYLLKSLEILAGDWAPMHTHAYGISIVLAPFLYFMGGDTIFAHMEHARLFMVILGTLFLVPAWLVTRTFLGRGGQLAVLALLAVQPQMIYLSSLLGSDILFATGVLLSLYFCIRAQNGVRYFYVASCIAGLSYWVRANGVFIIASILLVFFAYRVFPAVGNMRMATWKWYRMVGHATGLVALFFLMASPMLVDRYVTFGSPFTYGSNDKIFVEDFSRDVWAPNIPAPSLGEYLSTHTPLEWFDKFAVQGFVKLMFSLVHGWEANIYSTAILPIILLPVLYGLVAGMRTPRILPVYLFILVFVGGTSVVYSIMTESRFLIFMTPLLLMGTWFAIVDLTRHLSYRRIVRVGAVVVVVLYSLITPVLQVVSRAEGGTFPAWTVWASENVRGTLLAFDDGDRVMVHLPDTRAGGGGLAELDAPKTGLRIRNYGVFDTLPEGLAWHREHDNATHLLVSPWSASLRTWLAGALVDEPPAYLELVHREGDVHIFRIDWEAFDAREGVL